MVAQDLLLQDSTQTRVLEIRCLEDTWVLRPDEEANANKATMYLIILQLHLGYKRVILVYLTNRAHTLTFEHHQRP